MNTSSTSTLTFGSYPVNQDVNNPTSVQLQLRNTRAIIDIAKKGREVDEDFNLVADTYIPEHSVLNASNRKEKLRALVDRDFKRENTINIAKAYTIFGVDKEEHVAIAKNLYEQGNYDFDLIKVKVRNEDEKEFKPEPWEFRRTSKVDFPKHVNNMLKKLGLSALIQQ